MNTLSFEVSADAHGRPTVAPAQERNHGATVPAGKAPRRRKPFKATVGPVSIPVYATKWRDPKLRGTGNGRSKEPKRRRTYIKYAIFWKDGTGRRRREQHADLATAQRRALEIANSIANGQISLQTVTPADWATYSRALELLRPTGKTLELAVSEYAQAIAQLVPLAPVSLAEACAFYCRHHSAVNNRKTCPEIFAEMLRVRKEDGAAQNTLDDYASRLGKFTTDFTGPLAAIAHQDLDTWLQALPVARRTRNNYRGNLVDFYQFARRRGYIPDSWDPLKKIRRLKNEDILIEIFSPENYSDILAARLKLEADYLRKHGRPLQTLIPYLVIAGFAGCRHEELCPGRGPNGQRLPGLDWSDVDFDNEEIEITKSVARKISRDRLIPMEPNLVAWLRPYAKASGRVCELWNVASACARAAELAGVKWLDNGARKSFISYYHTGREIGAVARVAGTSPERIRKNYEKPAPKRLSDRWFNVWPSSSAILQLNFGLK